MDWESKSQREFGREHYNLIMAPALVLSTRERTRLKARAHPLEPVMQVGKTGVQEAVVAELERALTAHELVKVKINEPDRDARQEIAVTLSDRTSSALVQRVGKIVVLWRPRPEEP